MFVCVSANWLALHAIIIFTLDEHFFFGAILLFLYYFRPRKCFEYLAREAFTRRIFAAGALIETQLTDFANCLVVF